MNMIGSNALAMLTQQADEAIAELSTVTTITGENCGRIKDMVDNALKLGKEIEESRKLVKQPHLDAAANVDASYTPLRDRVNEMARAVKKMIESWAIAEKAKADAIAEEARKKAEELTKAQETVDPFLQDEETIVEAVTVASEAQVRAKAASQVVSASGAGRASGLKPYRFADVKDPRAMVLHYAEHPDVLSAATKLANAAIRAAKGGPVSIPGVEVKTEMRLA